MRISTLAMGAEDRTVGYSCITNIFSASEIIKNHPFSLGLMDGDNKVARL